MMSRSLVVGALALAACTDAHQLVLSITTSAGVPCDIDRVRVVATADGKTTIDQTLRGEHLPVEVVLLDGTPDGTFHVDISGYKGGVEVLRASGPLRFSGHRAVQPVLLKRACSPGASCTLAEAMAAGDAAASSPDPACVADVTRYTSSPAPDGFVNACMVPKSAAVLVDGSAGPVELTALASDLLAGNFEFYGRQVQHVWVARDGYLSFGASNPDDHHVVVPGPFDLDVRHAGAAPPVQAVMAFWDKVTLGPAGVCYVIDDTASTRVLYVTWLHACLTTPCGADDLNFTIALEEGATGRVELTYGRMFTSNMVGAQGTSATVGIVDDATGCPADQCVLATGLCQDGVTPCGYSQVFSNTAQLAVQGTLFTPVIDR